ncbi:MAG TPA: hypothetical protein VJY62_19540, partial [Bacteroidia bacterium]|nr:hypothetical protein [Bacteroidia bacterium]
MNLQDFVHFFAVLSVAYLIFGTRETILDYLFDKEGRFKKPEVKLDREFETFISEKLKKVEAILEAQAKKEEIVYAQQAAPVTDINKLEREKQNKIKQEKDILRMQFNSLYGGEWKNLKTLYQNILKS